MGHVIGTVEVPPVGDGHCVVNRSVRIGFPTARAGCHYGFKIG